METPHVRLLVAVTANVLVTFLCDARTVGFQGCYNMEPPVEEGLNAAS